MAAKLLGLFGRKKDGDTKEDANTPDLPLQLTTCAIGLTPAPRCVAVDPVQGLLAVAGKYGTVRM